MLKIRRSVLASGLFGGEQHSFVFRHISFTEYPVGGTNCKVFDDCERLIITLLTRRFIVQVVRHGIQCVVDKEFHSYDYGAEENERRYGTPRPPSYRPDYGLLDVPTQFVAGGRDALIPVENVRHQYEVMAALKPELVSLKVFETAGHLDFTLSLDDTIISYTLQQLEEGATTRVPSSTRRMEAVPMPAVSPRAMPMAIAARARLFEGFHDDALAEPPLWLPARECVKQYPWLAGFSKLDVVLDGLDAEAKEMGLTE